MNLHFILIVGIGGALGSMARYLVGIESGRLFGTGFPWGTLIINVAASFLIGSFIGLFATKWDLSQASRIFLTVGLCGGFSTFSTFALDTWYLVERGEIFAAMAYMVASAVLSTAALVAALNLVRAIP
jgi:fluoride exporter